MAKKNHETCCACQFKKTFNSSKTGQFYAILDWPAPSKSTRPGLGSGALSVFWGARLGLGVGSGWGGKKKRQNKPTFELSNFIFVLVPKMSISSETGQCCPILGLLAPGPGLGSGAVLWSPGPGPGRDREQRMSGQNRKERWGR